MVIATVAGIEVQQDPGTHRVWWTSKMSVDADGANGQNGGPFAYRYPDNNGLDRLADAGWPMYGWRSVLYDNGHGFPLTDGSGNAYSKTSYMWSGRGVAGNSVDAWFVPYVVVNPHVRSNATGIVLGCSARVTYEGRTIESVVADVGPGYDIGEGSVALAKALGINDSALEGGADSGVLFELFPGIPAVINKEIYLLKPA